jgi:hypothetical protein
VDNDAEVVVKDAAALINALVVGCIDTDLDPETAWDRLFEGPLAPLWGNRIGMDGNVWHCYGLIRESWDPVMLEYRGGKVTVVAPPGTNAANIVAGRLAP